MGSRDKLRIFSQSQMKAEKASKLLFYIQKSIKDNLSLPKITHKKKLLGLWVKGTFRGVLVKTKGKNNYTALLNRNQSARCSRRLLGKTRINQTAINLQ